MFGYWLLVLHQFTTNVQMFWYWILVLHCTTSGADGGAAKFAFQHSTVSPLQVSQQVIIICNTLIDNYISTAWIIFGVYFSFCNCRITSKCDLRWRQCPLSKYQQICTFYPRQQEIPFPPLPGQLGMGMREWVSSAGFILNAPQPHLSKPPTQQCLSYPFSAGPDHEWPHSTIVTWTQCDSQIGHSTGSHCA